jgi:hypothetical protein
MMHRTGRQTEEDHILNEESKKVEIETNALRPCENAGE